MRVRGIAGLLGALVAAVGVAACGEEGGGGGGGGGAGKAPGNTLTIYSSLPRQGASRVQAIAIENGAKLALEQAGGKAGRFTIKYVPLDDATAQAGKWDAGPTSANARKAAQDRSAIAYIGEYNSGATAISIPILNDGGVPQVTPAATAVGLTKKEPGAEPGTPDKYYPTRKRTFVRVPPRDTVQGAALVRLMRAEGCNTAYIVNDKEVYGAGLAENVENSAREAGLRILGNDGFDPKAPNYRSLAAKIKGENPDCLFASQVVETNGVQMAKDLAAAMPNAKLFGPDGLAISSFANPKEGGIPENIADRWLLTAPTLSPDEYPPEGRRFFRQFSRKYKVKSPDPYAIYGYEAMALILDAIERAGPRGNERAEVLRQLFATKDRESALGTYSIDATGDTTISDYGVYRIENGELTYDRTIKAEGT